MDRLVYLYELDSVRNSREEIIRGQQAMFEEIVKNGNKIVLSLNQITDSHAFLYAVQDKNMVLCQDLVQVKMRFSSS